MSFRLFYKILLFFILIVPIAYAQVIYPEYNGKKVIDLAKKFDARYLSNLENELNQYEEDIRIVFVKTDNNINLGIYTAKLFEKWNMPDNGILSVIDPNTKKVGYKVGKLIREHMNKRKKIEENNNDKSKGSSDINYQNLAKNIRERFINNEDIVIVNKNKKKDDGILKNRNLDRELESIDNNLIIKIFVLIILLTLLSYLSMYLYKKKKQKEKIKSIKDRNLENFELRQNDLYYLIEDISDIYNQLSKYSGHTKEKILEELNEVKEMKKLIDDIYSDLENFLKINDEKELLILEDLINSSEIPIIESKNRLEQINEKLDYVKEKEHENEVFIYKAKEFLKIIKERIDLNPLMYKSINYSEETMNTIKDKVYKFEALLKVKDPLLYSDEVKSIYKRIKLIKIPSDNINNISIKLNEEIIEEINNLISNTKSIELRKSFKLELNKIREDSIRELSNGNLKDSKELINKINNRINEIKKLSQIL